MPMALAAALFETAMWLRYWKRWQSTVPPLSRSMPKRKFLCGYLTYRIWTLFHFFDLCGTFVGSPEQLRYLVNFCRAYWYAGIDFVPNPWHQAYLGNFAWVDVYRNVGYVVSRMASTCPSLNNIFSSLQHSSRQWRLDIPPASDGSTCLPPIFWKYFIWDTFLCSWLCYPRGLNWRTARLLISWEVLMLVTPSNLLSVDV